MSTKPGQLQLYQVDPEIAKHESHEYRANEKSLPKDRRLASGHWSGRAEGLKGVAELVGLGADYAVQYRLYSGSHHGNRPWDQALFDPDSLVIVPSRGVHRGMAVPLAFDALRYLAWLLDIAWKSGAIKLYASEQKELDPYRKYMAPIDALHEKGIVGPASAEDGGNTAD